MGRGNVVFVVAFLLQGKALTEHPDPADGQAGHSSHVIAI
jgi:hypothetical protein